MKLAKNGKVSKVSVAPAETDESGLVCRLGCMGRVPTSRVSSGRMCRIGQECVGNKKKAVMKTSSLQAGVLWGRVLSHAADFTKTEIYTRM